MESIGILAILVILVILCIFILIIFSLYALGIGIYTGMVVVIEKIKDIIRYFYDYYGKTGKDWINKYDGWWL